MNDTTNDSPRSVSPDGTVVEAQSKERVQVEMPVVDLEYAATIKPSRLRGKHLMFMVTFVAGTGVIPYMSTGDEAVLTLQFTMFGYDQGVLSSLLTLESFERTFPQAGGEFSTLQSFMVAICRSCLVVTIRI
jgi:hypothetical protein